MSFWARFKRAASQVNSAGRYHAAGRDIICLQCGNPWFEQAQAQLNTAGMSFLNMDWLNASATTLTCTECGRIEWYRNEPPRLDQPRANRTEVRNA